MSLVVAVSFHFHQSQVVIPARSRAQILLDPLRRQVTVTHPTDPKGKGNGSFLLLRVAGMRPLRPLGSPSSPSPHLMTSRNCRVGPLRSQALLSPASLPVLSGVTRDSQQETREREGPSWKGWELQAHSTPTKGFRGNPEQSQCAPLPSRLYRRKHHATLLRRCRGAGLEALGSMPSQTELSGSPLITLLSPICCWALRCACSQHPFIQSNFQREAK